MVNRDLQAVKAAISQQNAMQKRMEKMQMRSLYANNTAESLIKGAKKAGYTVPASAYQPVQQTPQQSGGITADSLMKEYQQWLSEQQNTPQDLSSGGSAGSGYRQTLTAQDQQIPSLMDSVKNMSNEDLAKQINIANMVKDQKAQTQEEQSKNVADILSKLNGDSSMADKARQLLNQRNTDYTSQTGKTDYDEAAQRTLQSAIPSLAGNQPQSTENSQKTEQTDAQSYSNEAIAKIMADAGGGDEKALLDQLNNDPELAKQAQSLLNQRDSDYAALTEKKTETQPTTQRTSKQTKQAQSAYKQAQTATQTAKKKLETEQKKIDQNSQKLQSLQNSLAKAKKTAQKTGHYEQVNAIQQQIRGLQDTSADNKAFKKATEEYNKAKFNERAAKLKWANQALTNPVATTKEPDQTAITSANGTFTQNQQEDYTTSNGKGGVVYNDDGTVTTRHGNDTRTTRKGVLPSLVEGLGQGFTSAAQGIAKAVSNVLGRSDIAQNIDQANEVSEQATKSNPKSYALAKGAGKFLNTALMYSMANGVGNQIGATDAAKSVIKNAIPGISEKALETAANIVVGQAADTLIDTTPTAIQAYKDGQSGTELANTIAANQLQNLAFNAGGEAIPSILSALKSKGQTAEDAISNIAKNAGLNVNTADLNYQSGEDAAEEARRMLSDELARKRVAVQSPEDANKEASDILSHYMNETRGKENVQTGINDFINKAQNAQYPDEQAGSIVSAAKQNQWERGMKDLEQQANTDAMIRRYGINRDDPYAEVVTMPTYAEMDRTVNKMKQVRPDLADEIDNMAETIEPGYLRYVSSMKNGAESASSDHKFGQIYKDVGTSGLAGDEKIYLGEYNGKKPIDPYTSLSNLQKNVDKFEEKYGVQDETVKELLTKAKRAVNDIDDAVGNGKYGVAGEAIDNYQSAMKDLKKYAKNNIDGFDANDINLRSVSGSSNNIWNYQKHRVQKSNEVYDPDAYAGEPIKKAVEESKEIPSIKDGSDWNPNKRISEILGRDVTMAEDMPDGSVSLTEKIPTSRESKISGTPLETMPKVSDSVEPDGFKPTHYKDTYGVVPIDDTLKKQVANSKKIVVNDGTNFKDFVNEASSNGTYNKQFYYGKVSPELSADVSSSTGKNVDNYNIALEASYVRKDLKHHGNAAKEALRGQVAITKDNFEDFVKVFDNPDKIKAIEDNGIPSLDNSKREMLQFEKRIDGKEVVVTGVTDGRNTLFVDSFYETKAKADSKRVNANLNGSPSPTSKNVSLVEPSSIPSIDSAEKNVNNVDKLNKRGQDAFDQLVNDVKNNEGKANNIPSMNNEKAYTASGAAEKEVDPEDAVDLMSERMSKRKSKTDNEGYIGRGYTNTIKNSGLATDEQYVKGLDEQTRHFTVSEKESFETGKAIYDSNPKAFVQKYSSSMGKDQLKALGSSDVDAMHIAYGKLNQMAKNATDPVEAESLRRQASNIARNLTDAQHYNAQTLQANAKWRNNIDGALMSADGTMKRLRDEALSPKEHSQIDDASQKISEMLKKMLDGKMETTSDNQLVWQEVKKALDGYSQLKGKFTDKQIQNLTDSVLKDKDWNGIQDLLEMQMTGYGGVSSEAIDKATMLFDEAQKYGYNSRKYMDLEQEAYSVLAKDIQSQPGYKGASFGQKLDSFRYLMMLGNPKTQVKNIAGNVLFGKLTNLKDDIGALIETAADRANKASGGEGIQRTKSILNPLSESDKKLVSAAKEYGEEYAARALSGNKYTNPGVELDKALSTFGNGKVGRFVQSLSDLTTKSLDKADQKAMMNKYQNALARYVKANGKDISIFSDSSQEAKDFLSMASDYAVHQAEEAAFHQDSGLASGLTSFATRMKNGNAKEKVVGTLIDATIPFKKTPINVFTSCLQYSPAEYVYAFADAYKLHRGEIDAAKFVDDMAKATTGTTMYVVGGILANEGIIRIGSNKGAKEKNTDTRTGVQNGALYIGNHSIDLSDLTPAAYPLIAGATFQESFKNENDFLTAITKAIGSSASSLVETTMLMGINNILESVKYADQDESGITSVGKSVAESYAGQFLPTLGRAINSTVDDTQRSSYSSKTGVGKEVESTAKYLETKIPGLQQVGDWADKNDIPVLSKLKLQPAIDAWGNVKKQNSAGVDAYTDDAIANTVGRGVANLATPTKLSADKSTDLDNKIRELKERLVSNGEMSAEDADNLFPYTATSEAKIGGEKLSEKDWTQYQIDKGTTSAELAKELLTSGKYDDLSDTDKADILQKIYKFSKSNTAAEYGGSASSSNSKLSEAYKSGGAKAVIDSMIGSSEKSSFTSAVQASNSEGKASIDNVIDYLNAVEKKDPAQAKELASQASEYQSGTYKKQSGKWVYQNKNTTKTGTGKAVTIPGPDEVGLPKASTKVSTKSTEAVPDMSSKLSEVRKNKDKAIAAIKKGESADSAVVNAGYWANRNYESRYSKYSSAKIPGLNKSEENFKLIYQTMDSDRNGNLKKKEVVDYINSQKLTAEQKRAMFSAFANRNWKNPF